MLHFLWMGVWLKHYSNINPCKNMSLSSVRAWHFLKEQWMYLVNVFNQATWKKTTRDTHNGSNKTSYRWSTWEKQWICGLLLRHNGLDPSVTETTSVGLWTTFSAAEDINILCAHIGYVIPFFVDTSLFKRQGMNFFPLTVSTHLFAGHFRSTFEKVNILFVYLTQLTHLCVCL